MGVGFQPSEHTDLPLAKMARIVASVAFFACSALAAPQFAGDSSNARILQEQRFNAGAGKFGSAFAQEDGVVYREESGGNNERIGQYSYIGDDGKTYTVKYSAGVNGFRILGGDHIPSGGQTSAQNNNVNAAGEIKEYDYEYYDDAKPDSPFVNPHDPSHHQKDLLDGNLAGLLAGRTFTTAAPLPFGVETTPRPNRFFPPGQIKLDRFPEGFNFNFKSQ
eukprot:TRINITY_DN1057_c0_g1_i13.p1 TRINITY_DN1057_c0_g1~~TRINITY_DN1057_c0_g1_i13.p1  ORF type:complete len:245 (-),score=105.02 TRINITY_DN1057_c0_g1_i13:105-764(-)